MEATVICLFSLYFPVSRLLELPTSTTEYLNLFRRETNEKNGTLVMRWAGRWHAVQPGYAENLDGY